MRQRMWRQSWWWRWGHRGRRQRRHRRHRRREQLVLGTRRAAGRHHVNHRWLHGGKAVQTDLVELASTKSVVPHNQILHLTIEHWLAVQMAFSDEEISKSLRHGKLHAGIKALKNPVPIDGYLAKAIVPVRVHDPHVSPNEWWESAAQCTQCTGLHRAAVRPVYSIRQAGVKGNV